MRNISLLSWNIHESISVRSNSRFNYAEKIEDADIALIQEAPFDFETKISEEMFVETWMLEPSVAFAGNQMGLAIVSRYPILNVERITFPNPGWRKDDVKPPLFSHPKGALLAEVEHPERTLKVASIHLLPPRIFDIGDSSDDALEYVGEVAGTLELGSSLLDLVAGDFNTEIRGEFLIHSGFRSTVLGQQTRYSGSSHDDILLSKELELIDALIESGDSDHHSVLVNARIN